MLAAEDSCPICQHKAPTGNPLVPQEDAPAGNPSVPPEDAPTAILDVPCSEENIGSRNNDNDKPVSEKKLGELALVPYALTFEGVEDDPIGSPAAPLGEALLSESNLQEQSADTIVLPFRGGDLESVVEEEALVQEGGGPQTQPEHPSNGDPQPAKEDDALAQGGPQAQVDYVVLRHESDVSA